MGSRWILLLVVAVNLVHCNENEIKDPTPIVYEPSWVFKCIPNVGCQRAAHPQSMMTTNSSHVFYDSIDLCRTVCGRFGGIWPKPLTAGLSMQTVQMHPTHLRYDLSDVPAEARELIAQMTQVASSNLLAECRGNVTEVVDTPFVVYLVVTSGNLDLTWDTDEKYDLDVQTKNQKVSVTITAATVYGARHGLETFTQLVTADRPEYSDQTRCALRVISGARIKDYPAYRHRGLVLDTSRHFIPMKDIKRTIDGMAASKLNVFHWHVTDSHSFPLESTRVPQFTRYGAYSSSEIYSAEEVRLLIKYAQIRGVRVVIEIDSPAHAGNGWQWGQDYGFGDLAVCVNTEPWRGLCIQPPCGQLNPANPTMYRVLRNLYKDLAEALPKPALFHMGGDEVFFPCWNSSEQIRTYMQEKGLNTTTEGFLRLWSEFHETVLSIWDEELKAIGTDAQPVILWSSALTKANYIQKFLNKDRYVIEVWEPLDSPLLMELLRLGYRTISVPKDVWYLDHGFWGSTKFSNWRRMYAYILPKSQHMLGGEVAMWSEYVDKEVLDTRIWPRAAAVAERLWADPMSTASAAEPRLQRFRSRLQARGLRPDAMSPAWCEQHDGRCL
ncbi:chitooligosaccharidolytic beta-N-acetylglucosaminidase [Ostrinia furnacalis]|uniref:chitooligosaccharidolytic beta-N-acetylglucosaminidase n=1 Tax=Ostrinia furnacalis TaxID=93504 RepID=UPI00103C2336|nr:chitooligosaccharidolytic beta-N-acetylglucosaminidase [Ostrinia furnacalis]